jgi:uncharacterized membrane protein
MTHLLTIPSWNGLHPLIIHFPITLLLVAPLFVVVGGVLAPSKGRTFLISALILMVLGTASVFFAIETGEGAGELAGSAPEIRAVLKQHQELAKTTRVLFSLLTLSFAALLFVPTVLGRELGLRVNMALLSAFLIFYATGAVFLVNTASHGDRLVHELGVRAPVAPNTSAPAAPHD